MRTSIKLQLLVLLDFLSRRLGRNDSFLENPGVPQSRYYPDASLGKALLKVSGDYLPYSGLRNSRSQRRSVDRRGAAVPWLTYPSIAFLERLNLADKISLEFGVWSLEFGGGGSTVYFSRRSKSVITFELDELYLDSLRELGLSNVDFFEWPSSAPRASEDLLSSLNGPAARDAPYESQEDIRRVLANASGIAALVESADLILIDGGPRTIYAEICAKFAKATAIAVIDNMDRRVSQGLADRFSDKHFLKIPFEGIGPLNAWGWETTVLMSRTYIV